MDKVNAFFAIVGFLTTAFFLGWPFYWLIIFPLEWLFFKMGTATLWMMNMSAEFDSRMEAGQEPFMPPWRKNKHLE